MSSVEPAEQQGCTPEQDRAETLADALAARDKFIAAVGHELRNTVAPLVMLAEQFEVMPPSPDQLKNKLALLSRNLRKFVATVDRVTEVAQLRHGGLQLDPSIVDVAAVVRDTTSQLRRLAAAGGVELIVRVPGVVIARLDRSRLGQIVANLVTNAIRYGVGGGDVEIDVIERTTEIEITVRDHGPGIAADELAGIFDRFDHRRTHTSGGFGVGLFVVKTVATAMGGTANADNLIDGGARFSVVLPRG